MITKKPNRPRDPNQLAKLIVELACGTDEAPRTTHIVKPAQKAGGKGGAARAKALTPERRSEIAAVAAQARWKKG